MSSICITKKILTLFSVIVGFLLLNTVVTVTPQLAMAEDLQEQFVENGQQFSLDLFSQISAANPNKSLIFSPFSIQTCIALAYMGAGGETADQIERGLRLVSSNRGKVGHYFKKILDSYTDSKRISIANKFYVKTGYEVQDHFNEIAKKSFHSEAENLNFTQRENAAGIMNDWVLSKTNNKIKNLISAGSLNEDTRLVLINAIYFKGNWSHRFKVEATVKDDFWISETESIKVDMMNQKAKYKFGEFLDLDATAIEMAYESKFSMIIVLPNSKTGLNDLEKKIKEVDFWKLIKSMRMQDVQLKLPKFKAELEIDLGDTLKNMGMELMFSNDADFSGLLKSPESLQVSKVVHKAFIEVNEEGSEAAAATAINMRMKRSIISIEDRKEFLADHPMLYLIVDNSQNILFMGSVRLLPNHTQTHQTHDEL